MSEPADDSTINHPSYYQHASGVECIEIAEQIGFNLGSALAYIWRAGKKVGEDRTKDLKKALWYLRREPSYVNLPPFFSIEYDVEEDAANSCLRHNKSVRTIEIVMAHERGSGSVLEVMLVLCEATFDAVNQNTWLEKKARVMDRIAKEIAST